MWWEDGEQIREEIKFGADPGIFNLKGLLNCGGGLGATECISASHCW